MGEGGRWGEEVGGVVVDVVVGAVVVVVVVVVVVPFGVFGLFSVFIPVSVRLGLCVVLSV